MSWCCGSQLTPTPATAVIAELLAMTLAWWTITPLGSLVEPKGRLQEEHRARRVRHVVAAKVLRAIRPEPGQLRGPRCVWEGLFASCPVVSSRRKSYSNCLVDSTALA